MARYSLVEMTAITDLVDDVKRIGMQINKRTFIRMLHFSCRSMRQSRGRGWSMRPEKILSRVVKVNRLTLSERVMTGTAKATTGQERNEGANGCLRRHWSRNLRSMIVWTPIASLAGRKGEQRWTTKCQSVSIFYHFSSTPFRSATCEVLCTMCSNWGRNHIYWRYIVPM